jgi:hypothetical protein
VAAAGPSHSSLGCAADGRHPIASGSATYTTLPYPCIPCLPPAAVLLPGAVLYSRGDTHQSEYQMLSEAALLLLGTAPPSRPRPESIPAVAAANSSSRRFTAHMDFDSGSFLRGYARSPLPGPVFTPPLSTPRAASLISAPEAGAGEGGRSSAEGLRGLQVMQGGAESVSGIRWGSPEP